MVERAITTVALMMTTALLLDPGIAQTMSVPSGNVEPVADMSRMQLASFRLEINSATPSEWSLLPGIGPTLSARIVDDRVQNGPFRKVDELERVKGIGPKTMLRLERWLITQPSCQLAARRFMEAT